MIISQFVSSFHSELVVAFIVTSIEASGANVCLGSRSISNLALVFTVPGDHILVVNTETNLGCSLPEHLSKVVGLSSLGGLVSSFWSTGCDVPVFEALIPEITRHVGQWNLAQLGLVSKDIDIFTAVGILASVLAGDSSCEALSLKLGLDSLGNVGV
jgi:hypothetical protein